MGIKIFWLIDRFLVILKFPHNFLYGASYKWGKNKCCQNTVAWFKNLNESAMTNYVSLINAFSILTFLIYILERGMKLSTCSAYRFLTNLTQGSLTQNFRNSIRKQVASLNCHSCKIFIFWAKLVHSSINTCSYPGRHCILTS